MVLLSHAPGAQPLPAEEAKKDDRIRVRLHFGGKFAQDAPNLWRYVGGEVFNESFPLEAKYADVCLRLNDKFGDTVSFKYLCPGDDLDPDNLVQVQGDDDLTEMKDEYAHAVGDARSRTVRLKIYVFRAVIFEREVADQDAELEDEELMGEPGGDVSMDASCGVEESGPNWSDWGEPDEPEATESSLPSAQPSMDADVHHNASAAVASAAATAALQNISMTSGASGRTSARGMAAPLPASMTAGGSAGGPGAGFSSRRSSAGWQVQALAHQRTFSGTEGSGGAGGGGLSRSGRSGSISAAVAAAVAAEGGDTGGAYAGYPYDPLGVFPEGGYHGEQDVVYEEEEEGAGAGEAAGEGPGYAYDEQAGGYADGAGYYQAGYEDRSGDVGSTYWDPPLVFPEEVLGTADGAERSGSGPERQLRASAPGWQLPVDRLGQVQEQPAAQQAAQRVDKPSAGQQAKADMPPSPQKGQQQQQLPQEPLNRGVMNSGIGFYCDEELEDPYGEQYDESAAAAAAGMGLYGMHLTDDGPAGRGYGVASDGALQMAPRAADVAADGDGDLGDHNHGAGVFAALRGAEAGNRRSSNGGAGAGGALSRAVLGRLAAAADMLPRHISAFGESSRDNSQGGAGAGAANGSGPFLPSRITIFGDDESINGIGSGPDSGAIGAGKQQQGNGNNTGGLHRLALLGGGAGGVPRWPDTVAGAAAGGEAGEAGGFPVNGSLVGDSGRCITQEFGAKQQSSLLDLGDGGEGGSQGGPHGGAGERGRMSPLDPLLLRTGGLGLGGLGLLDDHHLGGSGGGAMNHPLKGVVKKRKSEVTIMAKIGEGAFGEVSQAMVFPYGIVAVKWLKRERFAKYSESFQREAETLAKLNHPNIIRMYGLVMDTPATESGGSGGSGGGNGGGSGGAGGSGGNAVVPASSGAGTPTGLIGGIITEFVRNGSLGQYLRSLNGRRLSLRQRAMIALQAALGMAYLHEQAPAVVHFDLKPDNLLVDGEGDSMVIKVADFGLSKHKLSSHVSCRDLRGTLPYMAYELVSNAGNISEKVDVYSMGVVMWEMYTGEVPFAHLSAQEILMGLLHGSLHLAIPPSCEPEWRSLVETCMDPNPANRPSFQELAMQLQEILRLERQASNASSVSAAAVAAAAAALVDSTTGTTTQQYQQQQAQHQQGHGAGGDSDGTGPSTTSGRAMAPPAAVLPTPQAAVAAAAAAAAAVPPLPPQHGLPQWRLPIAPIIPPAAPVGPSLPSPGTAAAAAGQGLTTTPQGHGLLNRQPLQLPPHPPPPHAPSPLLAQLAGGSQQPHPQQQPYGLASPQLFIPASPADLQYGRHGAQLPSPGHQQPPAPQLLAPQPPRPTQPPPLPPQPQHLQFQQQQPIGPSGGMGLAQPGGALPQNPAYGFPLRPEPLFPPQPQHIGLNAFYGMGGGAGAGPPLVSWGERGRG